MGVFYTGKGDKGRSYVGKKSVSKTCLEVEALGQLDELNSMLGVMKSLPAAALASPKPSAQGGSAKAGQKITKNLKKILHEVQENLFTVQSHVANIMIGQSFKVPEFKNLKVKELEKIIDGIEQKLPPLKKFVISGANQTSAWLDLLRAKSRNVERSVLKIKHIDHLNSDIKAYLNRLSSLFFALARQEAQTSKEKNPSYK